MIFTPKQMEFTLNRGDTFVLPIVLNQNTQLDFVPYYLSVYDKLYVGILEPGQAFEDAIIRRTLTNVDETDSKGNVIFKLRPEDTERLMTGLYYITVKLQQFDKITTVLSAKKFWITGTNPPKRIIHKDEAQDTDNVIIFDGGEII